MAAYAALVSLLNTIHQATNYPGFSTSLNNKHIQPLLEKIDFLLDFIESNNDGGGSKESADLEKRIASAAHAAEDLIQTHNVDHIHQGIRIWRYFRAFLLRFVVYVSQSKKPFDLQQVKEDMDAIMKEANEFKEKRSLGVEQQPTHLAERLTVSGVSGETAMLGVDAEFNQLLDELTGYQPSRCIISIVGMGGSGKTTLAKNVYGNKRIKEHFHIRAWATISQQNNAREILSELLSCLGEFSSGALHDIGLLLHKTLFGRRYLIVLDDIWSVRAWYEVRKFFPDNQNSSRVLLTTRLSNVAQDCGSSLVTMNLLDERNSWKLFCEKAFQSEGCPIYLKKVAEEIVKLCNGLALSIVVIGGLLFKSPRTLGYWNQVQEDLKSIPYSKEKQQTLDVLSLSYNHLSPHLKPCFLYMGLFKEDSQILVSKIIKLWVAEGFIKPTGSRVSEEIAKDYMKDLIDRNLILVGRRHKTGKVKSCVIHDFVRDLCIKVAKEEDFFHESEVGIQGTKCRLVENGYIKWTGLKLPCARSIIGGAASIRQLIKYRLLRALDENGHLLDVDCYENVNLRYLVNECQYELLGVWKLPTSMSLMLNLQTLHINIGHNFQIVVAPIEFWKMRQLRHIECCKIYLPSPPSNRGDEFLVLDNLQTLKTTINFRICEEVCKIIPNIKKLHVDYDCQFQGYDDGDSLIESVSNLDCFHQLESFNMTTDISTSPDNRDREFNRKLPTSFPNSLKKLSLSKCELHWDDLSTIGLSLPHLEVLNLGFLSVNNGNQWSPVDGQFPHLKFLKIEGCHLVYWDAENSHFPALESLRLDNLYSLEEIPLGLGDIPTLELICVHRCSESATISAVKIKEDQLDNDNQLHVQVNLLETSVDSFCEKLKVEGLTTDNIQLEIVGPDNEIM